jgi:V8-like Glu-specific endopeptidase
LNVGLKIKLQNKYWVQVADLSSKQKYYVFTTSDKDAGYQVVGHGSTFPINVQEPKPTLLVTNKHVLNNAKQIEDECVMFYAACMFYVQNRMPEKDFIALLDIINLVNKKGKSTKEIQLYKNTVNAIWDCYDTNLSETVDPKGVQFKKYKNLAPITVQIGYFLHIAGTNRQEKMIKASAGYRASDFKDIDLAILLADIPVNHIDKALPVEKEVKTGEPIQIVGYPVLDNEKKLYTPNFSTGKILNVRPKSFEFEAPISKGYSGGPVINEFGKVVGIVTQRSLTSTGKISDKQGNAIRISELMNRTPELFNGPRRLPSIKRRKY